jgi:hypothetical protein
MLIDADDGRPGVHLLVMGVGDYSNAMDVKLQNLSTASVSAVEFAHWMLCKLRYPKGDGQTIVLKNQEIDFLPVKTLELLVSAPPNLEPKIAQECESKFTRDALKANNASVCWEFKDLDLDPELADRWAFKDFASIAFEGAAQRWASRLDRSNEDVGIFYFCGHGIESQNLQSRMALLFGGFNPYRSAWQQSFDPFRFVTAVGTKRAKNVYFFVDACRNTPLSLRDYSFNPPAPLMEPADRLIPRGDLRMYLSAKTSQTAAGYENRPTLFTQAIFDALEGAGAKRGTGEKLQERWVVTSDSLMEGIQEALQWRRTSEDLDPQRPETQDCFSLSPTLFHIPDCPIRVPALLEWKDCARKVDVISMSRPCKTLFSGISPFRDVIQAPSPIPITHVALKLSPADPSDTKHHFLWPRKLQILPPVTRHVFDVSGAKAGEVKVHL